MDKNLNMPNKFPAQLNQFVSGSTSGKLGDVGHAATHNALETKIGIDGSTDVNSMDYKLAHRVIKEGDTMTGPLTIQPTVDEVNTLIVKNSAGVQVFEVDVFNHWVKAGPDQANFDLDPNVSFYAQRNVDGYHAINVINPSHGQFASSDVVAVNDTDDPLVGWVDLGINGNSWNDPNYATFDAGAGYVYCISNNFYVGTAEPSSKLYFFVGGHDNKNYIKAEIDPNGNMGIGGSPNAKSILDLQSTTKGFLPPRMTGTQRDAITSPPEGLTIYNLTTHKLNFYNGSAWEIVTSST